MLVVAEIPSDCVMGSDFTRYGEVGYYIKSTNGIIVIRVSRLGNSEGTS